MIGVVNYGSGNVAAISHVLYQAREPFLLVDTPGQFAECERVILPGVGHFDTTMTMLEQSGLVNALLKTVAEGKPFLGICVGMQILGRGSDEGVKSGLGLIEADTVRIDSTRLANKPYTPHLGWNSVTLKSHALFADVNAASGFYFLHSYHMACDHQENVLATTEYGDTLVCAVQQGNVYGVQFHPEKSHDNGVSVLTNFCKMPC